jgi:hypothetical protein
VGPGSIDLGGTVISNSSGTLSISGASDLVLSDSTTPSFIAISNRANSAFDQANLAFESSNTANTWLQANIGAARITDTAASQANVGFGLISVTNAYQANVGAARIADRATTEANVGLGLISVTNAYQANVGAGLLNKLDKTGGTISGDLAVTGNLTIAGNTTTINVTSLKVTDTIIQLGFENSTDALDIGFVGHYANTPNNHTGLVRKHSDGKYYLFDNLLTNNEPTNIIDVANTRVATLSANLVTNVISLRGLDPLDYANTIQSSSQSNVGAGLISVTNAYEANIGAARIADTASSQANVGAGLISYQTISQANVGAGLISTTTSITNAYQANVGAARIADTAAAQANTGAARLEILANTGAINIAKVNKSGDVMTGALTTSSTLTGSSLISNTSITLNTNSTLSSTTQTTSSTTEFILDFFSSSVYRSAKYFVQITSGSAYQVIEISLVHDGSTVFLVQYGEIRTGASLATFDANITGGQVRLLSTPTNASTTYKAMRTLIPV